MTSRPVPPPSRLLRLLRPASGPMPLPLPTHLAPIIRGRVARTFALPLLLSTCSLAALALPAEEMLAQTPDAPLRGDLPFEVADAAIALHNDSTTIRFSGRSRLPFGTSVRGNVSVLGGPFLLEGEIDGDLQVLNGELRIERGGRVSGRILVLGGRITGHGQQVATRGTTVYESPLRYTFRGDGIARVETREEGVSSSLGFGRSRFTVRTGGSYNRVEGLPVHFGPIIETEGAHPLRLEALGIWRTDDGLSLEGRGLGYGARVEQSLGGHDEFGIGLSLHSRITPIEDGGVSDLEASLTTFLMHQDHRDYFEEEGWGATVEWRPRRLPLRVLLRYDDSEHGFAAPGGPWSLTDNRNPWRPQPTVAEGRLRSLALTADYDSRNNLRLPTDGWWIRGTLRRGLGGTLRYPERSADTDEGLSHPGVEVPLSLLPLERRAAPVGIRSGTLDLRRYNRVGPGSSLSLRLFLGGSLDGEPLPPQFQHAAGGVGSFASLPLLSLDCGARESVVALSGRTDAEGERLLAQGGYGCDRLVLAHLEFRSAFPWEVAPDTGLGELLGRFDLSPSWALFFGTGRGWAAVTRDDDPGADRVPVLGRHSGARSELGGGIYLRDLGLFFAVPLQDEGRTRFFVRLALRI